MQLFLSAAELSILESSEEKVFVGSPGGILLCGVV